MVNLDRFRPPTLADEMTLCNGCQRRVHYEACDEEGFCEECRSEWCEEDRKDETNE